MYERIYNFEKLGFGMFVHFGLYSVLGRGEWSLNRCKIPDEKYEKLAAKFKVKKNESFYYKTNLVHYTKNNSKTNATK
jgi:alpha-L-fucosidase